jgi:hypothetical protein
VRAGWLAASCPVLSCPVLSCQVWERGEAACAEAAEEAGRLKARRAQLSSQNAVATILLQLLGDERVAAALVRAPN